MSTPSDGFTTSQDLEDTGLKLEKVELERVNITAASVAETADEAKGTIPEDGGFRGWMTVVGSWLILFSTLGYIYAFGVYQDYYTRVFLSSHSPSSIAWLGSFQLMMPFASAIIAGKLFDSGHFHSTIIAGSIIFIFSLFMLSLAHEGQYYQIFLSQGLGIGIGSGLIFAPATTVVSQHFRKRRALAYGTALTGISIGAVVFPISCKNSTLLPQIGFAKSVRATAYISLGCLIGGNLLMRPPVSTTQVGRAPADVMSFFRDSAYVIFIIGGFIALVGVYFPLVYMQLYAIEHAVDNTLAFYSLAIINGSGVIGRIIGNHLADLYGVWNIQVPVTLLTGATIWAVLGISSTASLIVVSIVYGILSGGWLSLTLAALATTASNPQEVGARVGVSMAIVSVGLLISAPIQGALLSSQFLWVRPIVFSGVSIIFSYYIKE
ncbi:major facilitator superfamily domain-containing protein [Crucibulum laeve]|uniref:Major facilitator superfamily domain-containing protein n=1 Tax=Crucibulum laeve TaxID=68775 RepID=A0A5C3LHN9_9AGAR|nr:major facilitator superfamily domain-containing protein [Crucibulum laeve]